MSQSSPAAPWHARVEFQAARAYLHARLPDLSKEPIRPRLMPSRARFDVDTLEELDNSPSDGPAKVAPESKAASRIPKVSPELIETALCLWMLSTAELDSGIELHELTGQAGGLYVLTMPPGAKIVAHSLRAALSAKLRVRPMAGRKSPQDQESPEADSQAHDSPLMLELFEMPTTQMVSGSAKGQNSDAQLQKIRSLLSLGYNVFVQAAPEQQLPSELAAFVLCHLTLPPIDAETLKGLHALCHPTHRRLTSSDLQDLPGLQAVSVSDWALALSYCDRRPLAETLGQLRAAADRAQPTQDAGPRLEDLVGSATAVSLGRQIVRDIGAWQQGEVDWPDIPNGLMLSGPPGCGKTLFARALAHSCQATLFKASYTDCLIGSSGGGGSHRLLDQLFAIGRDAADHAAQGKTAVIFIDEFDGFGLTRFGRSDHNSSYFRTLTAGLLPFLDTIRATPGVVLMAASNDVSAIDPALLRAGRFDHHLVLTEPALQDIQTLLARGLPSIPEIDLARAARRLLGCSFAEAENVIRSARALARAAARPVKTTDLARAVDDARPETLEDDAEDLWRSALHESGHALIIYLRTGDVPARIRLTAWAQGEVHHTQPTVFTPSRLHDTLIALMAGRAAEALILRDLSSGSGHSQDSDLARATALVLEAEHNWHMRPGTDLIWRPIADVARTLPNAERARIAALLQAQERAAISTLAAHKPVLLSLANTLLARRELNQDEIRQLLAPLDAARTAALTLPQRGSASSGSPDPDHASDL